MPEQLKQRIGAALNGFGGLWVRRHEDMSGQVSWDLRDGPLGLAMVVAAVLGFAVGTAQSGASWSLPRAPKPETEAKAEPQRVLQIQVRSDPPARETVAAAPPPPAQIATPTQPVQIAQAEPVPAPVQLAPRPALVAAPLAPPASMRIAARNIQVPIAVLPGQRPSAEAPRADEDDAELAAANRALTQAYRAATEAGVPAAELRADRQTWRTARADAAQQSHGALLNAYRDHIEDLRDMADEAGQQQRYPQDPGRGYAGNSPYAGYGGYGGAGQGYAPAYQPRSPRY